MIRKEPRRLHHARENLAPTTRVGDLSYTPSSIIPAAGESPWWWPLAAVGSVAVIVAIFFYGHKTGWT